LRPGQPAALRVTAPPPKPVPVVRKHVVKDGETLSSISSHYYGTANRWREILQANRDVLKDERSLAIGATLKIP
jgi:nucleoid-associated protein YgaU